MKFLKNLAKLDTLGVSTGYKKSPTEVGENVEGAGPSKLVLDAANGPADYFSG